MREIKFRGKRPFIGGWVYGLPDIQGNDIEIFNRENDTYTKAIIIPKTLGQFTGLYDKNGKEVFEGDVIKAPNGTRVYQVVFEMGAFRLIGKKQPIKQSSYLIKTMEIIGNIHENPELLEQ